MQVKFNISLTQKYILNLSAPVIKRENYRGVIKVKTASLIVHRGFNILQYWTRIENIVHWSQVQYFIISKYYNYMTLVWHISRLSNIKDVKCTNKCTQTCKSTKNRYITWHTDIQFLPECLINTVFDVMWDVKKRERCIKKV